jgi:DNA helicase-2/ATP-dependent DNA helicase PcrA
MTGRRYNRIVPPSASRRTGGPAPKPARRAPADRVDEAADRLADDPVGELPPPPDLSADDLATDGGSAGPGAEEGWFDLGREPALTSEPTFVADEAPLPSEPAVSAPPPTAAERVVATRALAARITADLNPEQARAVTTTDGPLLILAGAGSGKTRVLAHRVAYLVGVRGVSPWQILAVTFTNRAAGELRERIIALIGERAGRDVQAGTFHALCARVLRRDGEAIGIGRNFVVYDTDDQGALMKRILNDEGVEAKGPTRPSAILGRISRAKNEMVDPSEIDEFIPVTGGRIAVARLAGLYRERLAAAGALDFDDLLLAAVRLFDEAPEVLARYQDRWRYLHVDEYQDTNRPQYLWVKALAAKNRNLAVVGDDDQSIYGWRGADIRNILDFERDYPDAVVVKLEQNYRSTQLILDAAHAVVSRNTARTEKKLWTSNAGGRLIRRYEAYDEDDEAEWIARRIEEVVGSGSVLTRRADDDAEKLSATDVAVMYRMNAQSRAIEEAFLRYRIPCQLVGGTRFYQRREVKDALAYLRVLRSDTDVVSFERIINVPSRKIGDKTLEALRGAATRGELSTWEAIEAAIAGTHGLETLGSAARRSITDFAILIKRLRARIGVLGLPELVDEVLEQSGYRAMLADGTEEGEERWANLLELREVTTRYDDLSPEDALDRLLEETALVADQDSYEGQTEAVTLITLHAAKGLEFPVVFIAGLEEGVFPTSRAIDAEREMPARPQPMEEERRLAYVGITRAKRRLYLTHASRRVFRGMGQLSIPSRFLTEIPADLVEGPLLVEGGGAAGPLDLDLVFGRRAGRLIGGVRPGAAAFRAGSGVPGAPSPGGAFQPSRDLAAKRAAFAAGAPSGSLGPQRRRGVPAWDDDELADFADAGAEELPVRRLDDAGDTAETAPSRPSRPIIPGERRFRDGDRIHHARFGDGIVVTSRLTRSDEEVTVAFADPSVGRKTMLASLAGLDLVG